MRHPCINERPYQRPLYAAFIYGALVFVGLVAHRNAEATSRSNVATPEVSTPNTPLRRLTKIEYSNSLRDLLGIDIPYTADLPNDGQTAGGFDNDGDTLSLTPILLESYLKIATRATNLVLGTGPTSALTEVFPAAGNQSGWIQGLPMGSRGGVRVDYYFPRTGEYDLRAFTDYIIESGYRISSFNPVTPREGASFFHMRATVSAGLHSFVVTFPNTFALREGAVPNIDSAVGAMSLGGPLDIRASAIVPVMQFWMDGHLIRTFDIHGPTIGEAANEAQPGPPALSRAEIHGPLTVTGPIHTEARRHLMTCTPRHRSDERACAARILAPIARRAYRRDLAPGELDALVTLFVTKRQTTSFADSIARCVDRILISPDFLFRIELDPSEARPGRLARVSDTELATRLSYFLWSSIPDDELLEKGRLHQLRGDVLATQVRRMLADPKADSLVDVFAMQWLGLNNIEGTRPDSKAYPEFDDELAQAFRDETRLFLRTLIRDNHSILDVLSSDYTFVNERLALLYDLDGVKGEAFRKVRLPAFGRRGGIFGQGLALMATSHPAGTSPVLRGKWVLSSLLNAPPNPPPPGVPPLSTAPASDGHVLTARELIERHRISPVCAGCHSKMDPYGIALENYDVIGRWRTEENGSPIDATTALPRGEPFTGPAGLKTLLLSRSDEFAVATVARMTAFALGRRLSSDDTAAVRRIAHTSKSNGYRVHDIIQRIVLSDPFQMRRSRERNESGS